MLFRQRRLRSISACVLRHVEKPLATRRSTLRPKCQSIVEVDDIPCSRTESGLIRTFAALLLLKLARHMLSDVDCSALLRDVEDLASLLTHYTRFQRTLQAALRRFTQFLLASLNASDPLLPITVNQLPDFTSLSADTWLAHPEDNLLPSWPAEWQFSDLQGSGMDSLFLPLEGTSYDGFGGAFAW